MRGRHDVETAGTQHPADRREHLDRPRQVLDRHRVQHGVEGRVAERQLGGTIEVVHQEAREAGILRQLDPVHAEADDATVVDLGGQVGYPGGHEIEHVRARRHQLAVDFRQRGDGRVVDVGDEARLDVEVFVG
jgi:hypothetical protein